MSGYNLDQVIEALQAWVDKYSQDIIYDAMREADPLRALDHDFVGQMAADATVELSNSIAVGATKYRIDTILEQIKETDDA